MRKKKKKKKTTFFKNKIPQELDIPGIKGVSGVHVIPACSFGNTISVFLLLHKLILNKQCCNSLTPQPHVPDAVASALWADGGEQPQQLQSTYVSRCWHAHVPEMEVGKEPIHVLLC